MLSLEGKQLGNYDVIRRIRVGGMGAVYEGRQRTAFDRRVAIKVILGNYARDKDMRRRFAREARTIARLHHPHILQLIEFGDEQGVLFLVMPYIEGGTLTSYLRRSLPNLEEVSSLYQQLLDAVEYAHEEGLIHRDIKSSNVLLEMRRNAAPYLYLADFGLVRTMRQTESSQSGKPIPLDQVPGTPHYMAPEQTRGIVTSLTDIYALGVLLFQMLTGELPYNDDDDVRVIQMHLYAPIPSPCAHDASIPAELGEVVRIAMAKRPEERYRSVADLRRAFLAAVKGPGQAAIEEKETEPELHESRLPTPPSLPRRAPTGRPAEIPEPIIIPRRLRPPLETPQPALHEVQEWQEHSQLSRPLRPRARNREELHPRNRKRTPMIITLLLVPVFLIALLPTARVFGVTILPAGIPILGASPVATIYITAQTKQLQDTYLITASQDVKTPDQTAHTIPDRMLSQNASATVTVNTTGLKISAGAAAHGLITFTNPTHNAIQVPDGLVLINSTGVHIQIVQSITVPGNQILATAAIATSIGDAGNIAASTLSGTCCNNSLTYKNYSPFSGGVDGLTTHYVTQADLDGVTNSQQSKLQQKVSQQVQSQLGPDDAIANQPLDYTTNTTSNIPVNTEAQQVQVIVNVTGSATVYSRNAVSQLAINILNQQAENTLNKTYQVQDKPALISVPKVAQVKNGVISFDVSVRGTWVYTFTSNQTAQWLQPIQGSSKDAALAYLKNQPGISSVDIHLPFGSSQLPTTTTNIQIILLHSAGS